jgi:hypothetical protein
MIVYDIETKHSPKYDKTRPNYKYAKGWGDYEGMGIAVLALYDYKTGQYSHFSDSFADMVRVNKIFSEAKIISGYNIKKFDNPLARAHGIIVDDSKCFDEMEQLQFACGVDLNNYRGFSLDKVLEVNFENVQKMMNGADAPFLWQDGEHQKVIDYCLDDVRLEKMLLNKIFEIGGLISPKTKQFVKMSVP